MNPANRTRLKYAAASLVILAIEVLIALFVRDRFIRPYVGDVLVTALLCCMARVVIPHGFKVLPLCVFAFSVLVEVGQYFDYAALLGLDGIPFFAILLGSTFSWADIVCYAVGCAMFTAVEAVSAKRK